MIIGHIYCPKCSARIGEIFEYKGKPYFLSGNTLTLVGLHRCVCGRMFDWNGNSVNITELKAKCRPVLDLNTTVLIT